MIRKYNVTVNGKHYQVEVEELSGAASSRPLAAPEPINNPASESALPTRQPQESNASASFVDKPTGNKSIGAAMVVEAPMPGTIVSVNMRQGDAVSVGDNLLILEAMKMENEITSAWNGVVSEIHVRPGDSVNTNDPLISVSILI